MKLIIAGSRDIEDYDLIRQLVMKSGFWKKYGKSIEVVCGMARGVDRVGLDFAKKNGLQWHERPADWNSHGKAAGHVRNAQMADEADALLAVWDGKSPGTKGMIDVARAKGLEVKAYSVHRMWAIEEV